MTPALQNLKDFADGALVEMGTPKADPAEIRLQDNPVLAQKIEKRRMVELTKVSAAARQLDRLPRRHEAVHARMDGAYDGFDLIPALLELIAPERIEHLLIATLSYNRRNGERLLELIDAGRIVRCDFLCSEMFKGYERTTIEWLQGEMASRGCALFFARSHCKILLARTSKGAHVVIEGSQNLRTCRCYEQLVMTDDARLFEFHRQFIERFKPHEARKKTKARETEAAAGQPR